MVEIGGLDWMRAALGLVTVGGGNLNGYQWLKYYTRKIVGRTRVQKRSA